MSEPNEKIRKINYYDGLLLTADEFQLEQDYHTVMRQMHNRNFHGYGIARGLEVKVIPDPASVERILSRVRILPGAALVSESMSGVDVFSEVILTDPVEIDLKDFMDGDIVFIFAQPGEILDTQVNYKGLKQIHKVEKPGIYAEKNDGTDTTQISKTERVVLAKITLGVDVYSGVIIPKEIDGSIRVYSGIDVIEAETHRLVLHPEKVDMISSQGPSAFMEGRKDPVNAKRSLTIETQQIQIQGPDDTVSSGHTEARITGNLLIDKVGGTTAQYGKLTVMGDVEIFGDATIKGGKFQDEASNAWHEDNVVTFNRPDGSTKSFRSRGPFSGFEIQPDGFGASVAADYTVWPALLWNDSQKLWKISNHDTQDMDVGYGAPWDTLSKNGLADGMHGHTFLTNGARVLDIAGNPTNQFVKSLTVAPDGKVGIGTTSPPTELYVQGTAGISGDLTVNNNLTVRVGAIVGPSAQGVTLPGPALQVKGDLTVKGFLTSEKPSGLEIGNSTISFNHALGTGNASLEVFRGATKPKAEIIWDETNQIWKLSYLDPDTGSFGAVEVATVQHLPSALSVRIVQANDFKEGEAIYLDPDTQGYKRALANSDLSTGLFMVTYADEDNFILTQAGFVKFGAALTLTHADPAKGTAPLAGNFYYVSADTPGALVDTEPPMISNPIYLAESATTGFVLPFRPGETMIERLLDALNIDRLSPTGSVRIDQDGNVGIGMQPAHKLDVNGTLRATQFIGDGSQLTGVKASQWLDVPNVGIAYNGNVGIGIASPAQKLEVGGTVKATSFIGDGSQLTGVKASQWADVAGGIAYNAGFASVNMPSSNGINNALTVNAIGVNGAGQNTAVQGIANYGSLNTGVYGQAVGYNNTGTNYGIRSLVSNAQTNYGVYSEVTGVNTNQGVSYGGYFRASNSQNGNYALYAIAQGYQNTGTAHGLLTLSQNAQTNIGIMGQGMGTNTNQGNSYGGYFLGANSQYTNAGLYANAQGYQNTGTTYGLQVSAQSGQQNYGIMSQAYGSNTNQGNSYGGHFNAYNSQHGNYGLYANAQGYQNTGSAMGLQVNVGSGQSNFGVYANVSGVNTNQGFGYGGYFNVYNNQYGNYALYTNASGQNNIGSNFGGYTGAYYGQYNYGIYTTGLGQPTNAGYSYGGMFYGNNSQYGNYGVHANANGANDVNGNPTSEVYGGYFYANNGATSYGIYAQASAAVGRTAWAGYFAGNINLQGGAVKLNGVDYAEYMEASTKKEIPVGTSVAVDKKGKIHPAKKGDKPIGVISGNPTLVGGYFDEWPGKHERDEFGQVLKEEFDEEIMEPKKKKVIRQRQKSVKKFIETVVVEKQEKTVKGKKTIVEVKKKVQKEVEEPVFDEEHTFDETGKKIIGTHKTPVMEDYEDEEDEIDEKGERVMVGTGKFIRKERPRVTKEYNPDKEYIPRDKRPEWNVVGLLGQIPVRKGQPTGANWIKIRDISETVELWLVK